MNRTSANLLLKGKAEIRSIGEPCDPSCAMWFACQNSTPNGVCQGFILLDGKSKEILQENMRENDLIYLGNCTRTIQNGCHPKTKESLTKEVYRYLKPINDILKNRTPKIYTLRSLVEYEVLPDGTLRTPEPEPKPKIPEPISDVEIIVRKMQSDNKQRSRVKLKEQFKETSNPDVGV